MWSRVGRNSPRSASRWAAARNQQDDNASWLGSLPFPRRQLSTIFARTVSTGFMEHASTVRATDGRRALKRGFATVVALVAVWKIGCMLRRWWEDEENELWHSEPLVRANSPAQLQSVGGSEESPHHLTSNGELDVTCREREANSPAQLRLGVRRERRLSFSLTDEQGEPRGLLNDADGWGWQVMPQWAPPLDPPSTHSSSGRAAQHLPALDAATSLWLAAADTLWLTAVVSFCYSSQRRVPVPQSGPWVEARRCRRRP